MEYGEFNSCLLYTSDGKYLFLITLVTAPTIIVAAVTSVIKKRYLPSHIILGEEFGLKKPSMVLLEQIQMCIRDRSGAGGKAEA